MKEKTKANLKKEKKPKSKIKQVISKHKKFIIMFVLLCFLIYILSLMIKLFRNPTDTFIVEQGQIYQEENAIRLYHS